MPEGECGEAKEGKARQRQGKGKASRAFVCMCNAAGGEAEGRKMFMAEESRLGLDTITWYRGGSVDMQRSQTRPPQGTGRGRYAQCSGRQAGSQGTQGNDRLSLFPEMSPRLDHLQATEDSRLGGGGGASVLARKGGG